MKNALSLLVGAVFGASSFVAAAQDDVVMIELFTSQGCSSCPPADAAFADIVYRGDVLALSMHVDYWDYLGWRDTFARAEHTLRQIDYRDAMGARVIYTPQMIVEGMFDVPGYRADMIGEVVANAQKMPRSASIAIVSDAAGLRAEVVPVGQNRPAEIWVARFTRSAEVLIERGENRGRRIVYHNVVRDLTRVRPWSGAAETVTLPRPGSGEGIAIWLQDAETGRIVTASFEHG